MTVPPGITGCGDTASMPPGGIGYDDLGLEILGLSTAAVTIAPCAHVDTSFDLPWVSGGDDFGRCRVATIWPDSPCSSAAIGRRL